MPSETIIAILTLTRHKNGVRIERLVKELKLYLEAATNAKKYTVEIICLEDLHLHQFPLSKALPCMPGLSTVYLTLQTPPNPSFALLYYCRIVLNKLQ